jgi:hypothetical protein
MYVHVFLLCPPCVFSHFQVQEANIRTRKIILDSLPVSKSVQKDLPNANEWFKEVHEKRQLLWPSAFGGKGKSAADISSKDLLGTLWMVKLN